MVEHGEQGIIAYNIDPGHVITERQVAKRKEKEYIAFPSAPPEAIGAAVAWLVEDPLAPEEYAGTIVNAQRETKRRGTVTRLARVRTRVASSSALLAHLANGTLRLCLHTARSLLDLRGRRW